MQASLPDKWPKTSAEHNVVHGCTGLTWENGKFHFPSIMALSPDLGPFTPVAALHYTADGCDEVLIIWGMKHYQATIESVTLLYPSTLYRLLGESEQFHTFWKKVGKEQCPNLIRPSLQDTVSQSQYNSDVKHNVDRHRFNFLRYMLQQLLDHGLSDSQALDLLQELMGDWVEAATSRTESVEQRLDLELSTAMYTLATSWKNEQEPIASLNSRYIDLFQRQRGAVDPYIIPAEQDTAGASGSGHQQAEAAGANHHQHKRPRRRSSASSSATANGGPSEDHNQGDAPAAPEQQNANSLGGDTPFDVGAWLEAQDSPGPLFPSAAATAEPVINPPNDNHYDGGLAALPRQPDSQTFDLLPASSPSSNLPPILTKPPFSSGDWRKALHLPDP